VELDDERVEPSIERLWVAVLVERERLRVERELGASRNVRDLGIHLAILGLEQQQTEEKSERGSHPSSQSRWVPNSRLTLSDPRAYVHLQQHAAPHVERRGPVPLALRGRRRLGRRQRRERRGRRRSRRH
jgi:hypothetical protein